MKVNMKRAHKCFGHIDETATCMNAEQLGMELSRTGFGTCKSCAIGMAKQCNIPKESTVEKATAFNGHVGHDLSKIKVPEELNIVISKPNWHIMVDELSGFKRSEFFKTNSGIIEYMCKLMHSETKQGYPIKILCQDNAGENVKLVKMAKGKDWKLSFVVEYTAGKTSQQNSLAEMSFTVIAVQARSMMIVGQIPNNERFKLWPEAVVTATNLNNLMPVTFGDITKTRWEHAGYQIPAWTKNLCMFGKAGIVKDGKKGKVLDRGVLMMFVGYSKDHTANVFWMYCPETSRISQTHDVIWLGRMLPTRCDADLTQQLPIVTVPISMDDMSADDAETQKLEVATFPLSEERGVESNSPSKTTDE
jgi:hypothetical protein